MKKIPAVTNAIFYTLISIILLTGVSVFGLGFFKTYHFGIIYTFIYLIIPLTIISLLLILSINFKKFSLVNGLKKSSINIFAFLLCSFSIWSLNSYSLEKSNQIKVAIVNNTGQGLSQITLIGRHAKTKIDTLAPEQKKTVIFKGKLIDYKTENDFENEIRLLYYAQNEWTEHKILSGFSRWRFIDYDLELKIIDSDSIVIDQL